MRRASTLTLWLMATAIGTLATTTVRTQNGEWRNYSGDSGSRKYSPLDQINKDNVKTLKIAWRRPAVDPQLMARDPKLRFSNNFRATPLMVNGVLYSPNGTIGTMKALSFD